MTRLPFRPLGDRGFFSAAVDFIHSPNTLDPGEQDGDWDDKSLNKPERP